MTWVGGILNSVGIFCLFAGVAMLLAYDPYTKKYSWDEFKMGGMFAVGCLAVVILGYLLFAH